MHREKNKVFLKPFKNLYCDGVFSSLGRYIDVYECDENEILNLLSRQDIEILIETAVLKNKVAGVKFVNIKVPFVGIGVKLLEKHGMQGNEILSARQMTSLTAGEAVGGQIGFDVENLLDYAEGYLAELSDFVGQLDIPIFISFGRDIEEVGKLVNRYNMSPAEIIESLGFLDRKCFFYGLNYIDKEDQKLLKNYSPTLIFMPKNDGEEGRGVINLYNFVYHQLKFCFSSGKCYNIDMLGELKQAKTNTSNLMHERGLLSLEDMVSSIELEENPYELSLDLDEEENEENILEKMMKIEDQTIIYQLSVLEEKTKEIAKRIKEKI